MSYVYGLTSWLVETFVFFHYLKDEERLDPLMIKLCVRIREENVL